MFKNSFFIVVLLLCNLYSAQGFKVRHFPLTSIDNLGLYIEEKSPGKYFAGGFINDTITGKADFRLCVMELNAIGQIQWIKKYGSSKFTYLNNLYASKWFYKKGNDFFYTGCVYDSLVNKYIGILLKFNANGDTLWQKKYRTTDTLEDVIPQSVTASTDGGFLITGFFQHSGNHSSKLMLIKTDANGNELWRKRIQKNNPNVQDGKAILQDSATKKIVMVGYQYINSNLDNYTNFTICDSLGNLIMNWAINQGMLTDIIQTKEKKFIACGRKEFPQKNAAGDNYNKSLAFKFDINSPYSLIWNIDGFDTLNLYNGFGTLFESEDGSLYFAGGIGVQNNYINNSICRISKFDKNANFLWNSYYNYKINGLNYDNNQGMRCLTKTSDGGMIAAIPSINNDMPNPFFFVKYDANGCDTSLAYCTTLLSDEKIKSQNTGMSIFPNPVNDILNIKLSISSFSKPCSLKIIDMLGKTLMKVELDNVNRNAYLLNLNHFEKGIYFLQVWQYDKLVVTEKIIKD
ncbi:MAG: T9SS type A sorting domain-containing protein [Bacteroidota bacterium]